MKAYQDQINAIQGQIKSLQRNYNILSTFRFVAIIATIFFLYKYLQAAQTIFMFLMISMIVLFLIAVRVHQKVAYRKAYYQALAQINQSELDYLTTGKSAYPDGSNYANTQHAFAHDLDVFGKQSLFHHLNRTHTIVGSKALAQQLITLESKEQILKNQQAINELSSLFDWRQKWATLAKLTNDNLKQYNALLSWNESEEIPISKWSKIMAVIAPMAFVGLLIAYIFTNQLVFLKYLSYVFVANQIVFGAQFKKLTAAMQNTSEIDQALQQYAKLFKLIEEQSWQSTQLQDLQKKLIQSNDDTASKQVKKLSELFAQMDTMSNLVVAIFFNGIGLYHLHIYQRLCSWKKRNQQNLSTWLEVIGKMEVLQSLANLRYNNPEFSFPQINQDFKIEFHEISHPLLPKNVRIANEVSFSHTPFMILTGSNMSGKSTFLRSIGVNMLLAGIGSPICATSANIHPLPMMVSMRLSDSLADSESYFFAEIKRLKAIMDQLTKQRTFVLLDEILRGTNSDDKQNGTIGVIEKMIAKQVIGIIATHDVEVCELKNKYPQSITNACFEAQIVKDNLLFDYKLREGVCQNKSATFLMKKMEII